MTIMTIVAHMRIIARRGFLGPNKQYFSDSAFLLEAADALEQFGNCSECAYFQPMESEILVHSNLKGEW